MAIGGNKAFFTDAYAEGFPSLLYFDTSDPQTMQVIPGNRNAGTVPYVATDGNISYWAYKGVYWAEPPTHSEHTQEILESCVGRRLIKSTAQNSLYQILQRVPGGPDIRQITGKH